MSGQQPSRPWLRLATMRPPPQPAAPSNQAPPPPRPPVIRPTFTPTAPPPPQQPTPTPPPPQQPTPTPSPPRPTLSPVPATNVVEPPALPTPPPSFSAPSTLPSRQPPSKAATGSPPPSTIPVSTTRAVTPPSSPPKIFKPLQQTPPANLVTRQASPPSVSPPKKSHLIPSPPKNISPLVLPSLKQKPFDDNSSPEYNQKTIHVQETKEKPKTSSTVFNGGGVHAHNFTRKPETHKKHWDSEDAGKNIITIAGENKGAIMNITPFSDKQHNFGNNRHKPTTSNNGETDSEAKNKNQNSDSLLKTSFLNSNVQGVNNSIIFNCSISHHDPGIHLTLSTKSDRDSGFHSKENKKG
ncbi:hypothetical protein L1987_41891 [Smallanthus sonchifolius]|uniref:Uncharacterized protein n=1 Tax=Smallanthus sonchifolius TaxID=185202 RepID=A0ACB9GVF3_9ASTR|nr:hypothetical protein L1987_41891 [Smallanthus sonchifolius]